MGYRGHVCGINEYRNPDMKGVKNGCSEQIDKHFCQRSAKTPGRRGPVHVRAFAHPPTEDAWNDLRRVVPSANDLERNKMIAATRKDPAHVAFDVLRSRMTVAMRDRGWHRVGITSPTEGCGKSFVTGNLALSFSRQEDLRTVVMDLDLNSSKLAGYLGASGSGSMSDFLAGHRSVETHFARPAQNLGHMGTHIAMGLNDKPEMFGAEILQYPSTEIAINEVQEMLDPDIMIFDLPPVLSSEAVTALGSQLDCILLVVAGDRSKAPDISEAERLIAETNPLLGVVMNKSRGTFIG